MWFLVFVISHPDLRQQFEVLSRLAKQPLNSAVSCSRPLPLRFSFTQASYG